MTTAPFTDVGVDLDGVLYPFTTAFRRYCQVDLGLADLPEITSWNFYEEWGMTSHSFMHYLRKSAAHFDLFGIAEPMAGTLDGWDLLKKSGVQIHVVTSRVEEGWKSTVGWLEKYGLIPDHLHFTRSKHVIANLASGRSAAIDDHTVYFDEMNKAGIHAALRTQPWNMQHVTLPEQRFASFRDFAQFIAASNYGA